MLKNNQIDNLLMYCFYSLVSLFLTPEYGIHPKLCMGTATEQNKLKVSMLYTLYIMLYVFHMVYSNLVQA